MCLCKQAFVHDFKCLSNSFGCCIQTNRWGVPYVAVILTSVGSCICFITGAVGNGIVLTWLIALSGVTTMIAWASITFGAYRFRRAWIVQGYPQSDLLYKAPGKNSEAKCERVSIVISLMPFDWRRLPMDAFRVYCPYHHYATDPRMVVFQ